MVCVYVDEKWIWKDSQKIDEIYWEKQETLQYYFGLIN